MSEDIWILSIHTTKFGKHRDRELIVPASGAALAALDGAGVTIADIGVLASATLMSAHKGVARDAQKQIVQTGIAAYKTWRTHAPAAQPLCVWS